MKDKFGTSPVPDSYFKLTEEEEDKALRDLIFSSQCKVEIDDDIEKFDGIAFEITDEGIKTSQGWKDFFRSYVNEFTDDEKADKLSN